MKIPRYARYEYCNRKAYEFLEEFNLTAFPIDIERIIRQSGWGLVTYTELMSHFQFSREKVIQCLGSKDGFTTWDGDNYTISYNDDKKLGERTRFTLMHEVAHIYLNHLTEFEATQLHRGALTHAENIVLENEANAFARNVLMPEEVISKMQNTSPNILSLLFGVSYSAAATRLNFLALDRQYNSRAKILFGYSLKFKIPSVIDIFAESNNTPKYCSICGTSMHGFDTCMICGHTQKEGVIDNMKYKEYETDPESGRLKSCMFCGNDDILGDYCHICGKPAVNYCAEATYSGSEDIYGQCQSLTPLPGNARYCIHCGSKSTFFKAGLLNDYKTEKETFAFMDIPDGIDASSSYYKTSQDQVDAEHIDMIIPDATDGELPFN